MQEYNILSIKKEGTEDIIFTSDHGKIRNQNTLRDDLRSLLIELGLKRKNTTFHGLRRTYGTLMTWAGVEIEIVSKLLGHKPDIVDGCAVARTHYIKENTEAIEEAKKDALQKYMAYMGDIFEKK